MSIVSPFLLSNAERALLGGLGNNFDDGPLAEQQLVDQWHELVFHVQNSYMDPPRFARPSFVCDKKKVATIYPACLRGHIAAGPDEFRAS